MMTYRSRGVWLVCAAAFMLALGGCLGSGDDAADSGSADTQTQSSASSRPAPAPAAKPAPVCSDCGTIAAIEKRRTQGSNTSKGAIAGTVAGAVAGVVVGNQIGSGSGKDIAKVVGGLGGAAAGHEIGKRMDTDVYYAVTVNMEDGGSQVINVPDASALSIGQKVRVRNGNIVLR